MNDQRPTRWPCSADSSRNAGPEPRSFRNAETGVSVSSMKVSHTGTRLLWVVSATPGKEDLLGVRQAETARVQQDGQVVEDVGGLLRHPPVALLARRAGDLLGLLADLGPDAGGVVEQLDGVRAFGALGGALGDRALERRERLVRRLRLELAVVEARARPGVARRAGRNDDRQDRIGVAVVAQRLDRLGVARGRALAPQLAARAAPEVQLAGLARALHGLAVHVRQREHLTGAPVLNHAGHEPAVVVRDVHGTPDIRPRRAARLVGPRRDRPTALVREAGARGGANLLLLL